MQNNKPGYINDLDGLVIYGRLARGGDELVARQVTRLHEHLRNHGVPDELVWDVPVFSDLGTAGTQRSRPGLHALLEEVKAGRVRTVLVTGLDRLGRGGSLVEVGTVLGEQGVEIATPGHCIDLADLAAVA